jgi:hypothetical protein
MTTRKRTASGPPPDGSVSHGASGPNGPSRDYEKQREGRNSVLWLILGIVLLCIAIAGGAIVHPVLFALGIVALFMFFRHFSGRRAAY